MYPFYAALYEADCAVLEKGAGRRRVRRRNRREDTGDGRARRRFPIPAIPPPSAWSAPRCALCCSTDALVILDEAYMDFWDQSLLGEAEEYDNLVILKTCSKAVGLANIRLGFAVANERITDALRAVKSPYNVNGVSAMIGAAVLEQQGLPARSGRRACRVPAGAVAGAGIAAVPESGAYRIYPSRTNFLYVSMPDAGAVFAGLKERGLSSAAWARICASRRAAKRKTPR